MEKTSANWLDQFYELLMEANQQGVSLGEPQITANEDPSLYRALRLVRRYNMQTKAYLKRITQQQVEHLLLERLRYHQGELQRVYEEVLAHSKVEDLVALYRKFMEVEAASQREVLYDKCLLLLLEQLETSTDRR